MSDTVIRKYEISHKRIMLFFSNFNQASLKVKIALNEIVKKYSHNPELEFVAVDYDKDKLMCKKYDITGIPTILIFCENRLIEKYYGEINADDFTQMIHELINESISG